MTPEEKAQELIDKFSKQLESYFSDIDWCKSAGRRCAIIHCQDVIDSYSTLVQKNFYQSVLNILKSKQ